jgi:hypothetical protein
MKSRTVGILIVFAIVMSIVPRLNSASEARIEFTAVPGSGQGANSHGDIAGRVVGLGSPQKYKVVLYAHTDWWYVQPQADDPFTDMHSNGTWSNWTHLGQRYAALVVNSTYKPAAKIQALPHVDHKNVIARDESAPSTK